MMRCPTDSALSKQQRRQFSASAARAEQPNFPQARRKDCNDVNFCAFCEDVTAYAVRAIQISPIFVALLPESWVQL